MTKHSFQRLRFESDGRGKTYSDDRTVLSKTEVTASICTKRGARSKVGRVVSRGALSAAAMLLEKDSSERRENLKFSAMFAEQGS